MRHHNQNRKFGREAGVRLALMRSLMVALIETGRIKTTLPKARALRPLAERLVTHAKRNTLASRRLIVARLGGERGQAAEKLAKTIAPRYTDRPGGYTRITKLATVRTDAAPMAIIEFV